MKLFPDDRSRMLPQHRATDRRPTVRRDLKRSVRLFSAFRAEQTDQDRFYGALAEDSIGLLEQWVDLGGAVVVDVGGGPGYFSAAYLNEKLDRKYTIALYLTGSALAALWLALLSRRYRVRCVGRWLTPA